MSLDKFEGARMILQPILNNFPQYNDAMSNLGLTHMCRNDLSEAGQSLFRATKPACPRAC